MGINSQVSKQMRVKPLKPGETKIFRRINSGEIDPQTSEPYRLMDYWQSGRELVYDPFAKKRVLLLNETGTRIVKNPDGTEREEPIVEAVKWPEGGDLIFTEENYETMCYVMRSNKNKDNPFRTRTRKALYYEVNVYAQTKKELASFDLTLDAGSWARDATLDELQVVRERLNINVSDERLRVEILNRVQNGEARDVMIASNNTKVKKKIQVKDAEKYGFIIFSDEANSWYWAENLEKPICSVSIDQDPVEGLIEFFATEKGRGGYARLAKEVKKLYAAVD